MEKHLYAMWELKMTEDEIQETIEEDVEEIEEDSE